MLTIEDKPERPICSIHGALKWGYFTETRRGPRWVSFTFEAGGVLVPHVCDDPDAPAAKWQPDPAVAERARIGAALAAEHLAAAKAKKLIEEEARDG